MKTNPFNESQIRPNDKFGRFYYIYQHFFNSRRLCFNFNCNNKRISIVGRVLFSSPLLGDFELVKWGVQSQFFLFYLFVILKMEM